MADTTSRTRGSRARRALAIITSFVLTLAGATALSAPAYAIGGWTATLVGGATVMTGDSLTYQYNVQCATPSGCGTLTATVPAPAGYSGPVNGSLPTVTVPSGTTGVTYVVQSDGTLVVTWANPSPGQSNQVQLSWPTADWTTTPGAQPVTATVTDGSTTQKPTATDTLTATPSLTAGKSAPGSIEAGSTIVYWVSASDADSAGQGNLALTNVTVTDPLPAGVTYVSCDPGNSHVTCTESVVGGVQTVVFTYTGQMVNDSVWGSVTVKVAGAATTGTTITNTLTASGVPLGTTTPVTSSASAATTVIAHSVAPPTATISKSGPSAVMPGQTDQSYLISYANTTPTTATLTVVDDLPAGFDVNWVNFNSTDGTQSAVLTFSDGSTQTVDDTTASVVSVTPPAGERVTRITLTVADLATNQSGRLDVTGTITAAAGTTLTNCAEGTPTNANGAGVTVTSCATTPVVPLVVDSSLAKSVDPSTPVLDGATLTWTLAVTNDPSSSHSGALTPYLIDLLPTTTTYVAGSFAASSSNAAGCPVAADFGVTVVPGYAAGRTAVVATTKANPGTAGGQVIAGGTGATVPNGNTTCAYTLRSTVNAGVAAGTYGGVSYTGATSDATYPVMDSYAGNDAYLLAGEGVMRAPTWSRTGTSTDAADIDKNGTTTEVVTSATSDFQVASAAALRVTKRVQGNEDSASKGSAEEDATQYGTSTPGGTVTWTLSLGNNGNRSLTDLVAYDLLPSAASGGTNTGVTSTRYTDTASSTYANQFVPTLTGPVTPSAGDPVAILYSTNPNPCRPEMASPGSTVAAITCGGDYQANNDWVSASAVTDWSAIRAIRFSYGTATISPVADAASCGTPAKGCFDYTVTMAVPTADANGVKFVPGTSPYTWNKIAAAASSVQTDGSLSPLLPTEAPWVKDVVSVRLLVPTVTTTVSTTRPTPGATLTDSVVVTGTGGETLAGTWTLLGPVAPNATGTCTGLDWSSAATFDSGSFTVAGDSTVTTSASKPVSAVGCYTYVDALAATTYTAAATTAAGEVAETAQLNVVSIGDYVWYDVNRNGLQDSGEPPRVGMTVQLLDGSGAVVATTVTDSAGYYAFANLAPSTAYVVKFVPAAGESFTTQAAGTDRAVDSNPAPATGLAPVTTPAHGSNLTAPGKADDPTVDAGVVSYNLTLAKQLTTTGDIQPGDTVTFSLTPHNDGPVDALAGWSVTDVMPAGLTLTGLSGAGYTCTVATGTCVAGAALAAGTNGATITVTATVAADFVGTAHNVAYVAPVTGDVPETNPLVVPTTTTDTDRTPTDNDAQASLDVVEIAGVSIVISQLASTGAPDVMPYLVAGLLLVTAGGALVVGARRRRL